MDKTLIGTDLKFILTLSASGFDPETDDWHVDILRGNKVVQTFHRKDLSQTENGEWLLCIETKDYGTGPYDILVTAHVPDVDFPDGIRTELYRQKLINLSRS